LIVNDLSILEWNANDIVKPNDRFVIKTVFMKSILLSLTAITFFSVAFAQHPFIRIYNSEGQKFVKGHLQMTNDSGLVILKKGKESEEIKYNFIHKIRMRRSAGMTALIVGGIPVIWGTSLIKRDQNWDGLVGILLIMEGMVVGPAAGGIKAILNPKPLMILGNQQKWMQAKMKLDQKLSK
jgi:hypothetical protein